ncbi:efflux RND transporter periplasmic adaptor subunit [uncultured Tateyamaria sp.]|uniref:efflux RND transporter periplasmic adaptor subunit n=1 Tax=uncultured Tateyamaria sp. TaxID=455651 RepID=UPI002624A417|nr:efflux RND transporter periplasmic adaptor subunit [uncultured Tateyamaria sp.]
MTKPLVKTVLISMALGLAGAASAQETPAAVYVRTENVSATDEAVTRRFFGQIAAKETVDISFKVGGYLTFIDATEGTRVEAGTLLAGLDLKPFQRAVERAELSLAQAERDVDRARALVTRNVGTQLDADNTVTARDLAEVELREARAALADAQIHAPYDALVADRIGANFTTITPGQAILRLHNMSEIRVEFDLPERLLTQIGGLDDVTFKGQLGGSDTPIPLEFRELRAETDTVGQSYRISLAAAETRGSFLLPGRTTVVEASISGRSDGITVPATAIATLPDGSTAVVTIEPNSDGLRARFVPVEVQSSNGVEFIINGISSDTEIVSVGAHLLSDGQAVKRFISLTVEGS